LAENRHTALAKAYHALKPGGILAINRSDATHDGMTARIADSMNKFIARTLKALFYDCRGLVVVKRPRE